jgi:hypothetical protein
MSNNMLSLYDYLGRAAGKELGKHVAAYAHNQKTKIETRQVSNPIYSGPVNLYTENFLLSFFNNPDYRTVVKEDSEWYESKKKKSLERKISETQDNTLPF